MTVEKKAPEIRLQGFSRDWQNKKIGSILAETKRPVELLDNELYQLVTVKRRNEGVVPRSILKGKDILVKNYCGIKAGDYLISKRQVVHGANGIVPDSLDNAVVSNEYLVVTDSDEITAKFWTVISKRPEMHKLFFISSYGVDIEKLVFDVTDWKNRNISIPEKNEQNAITDFFQKLDSLINQHQQKHDKLSNIKKAMLEKMFPKQGETMPEIRFQGFSGKWESCSVGSITDFHKQGFYTNESYSPSKKYYLLRGTDLNNNKLVLNDTPQINASEKDYRDFKVEVGDVLLVRSGNVGTYGIVYENVEGIFGSYLINFRFNQSLVVNEFFGCFYQSQRFLEQLKQIIQQSANTNINAENIKSVDICLPNLSEQTKIGNYFQKLDALISQYQQQITKLNNIKQACLSKMFV